MKNHTNLLDNYQRSHCDTITIGAKGKFYWVLQLINSQKVPEGTDFGQSRFGHPDLTNFGQSNFGQSIFGHRGFGPANFGQIQFWPTHFWPELVFQWFHNLCGPEGLGPEGWGPEGWGPKISRFFFPSPPSFSLFFVSLWVSSRGFLVGFWKRGAVKCARLEFSGCCVKPRRPRSRVSVFTKTTKIQRADTQ